MEDLPKLLKWIFNIHTIDSMNLETMDLNLLKVFDALYEARNVTQAGRRVGLAQPSMSNALARLRHVLDDDLFVRSPNGMIPTARADVLAPKISAALSIVQEVVQPAAAFDPSVAAATISLAASDNVQLVYGAKLAVHFRGVAPNFNLRLRTLNKDSFYSDLDAARIDVALCRDSKVPARFFQKDVLRESFVCIARKNHPQIRHDLDAELFAKIPQVLMTLRADERGVMDTELKKRGLERRVAVTVSHFMAVIEIVAATDYIAVFPASMCDKAEAAGCAVFPVPVPIDGWTLTQVWSQAANANPAKRFFVDELASLLSGQV